MERAGITSRAAGRYRSRCTDSEDDERIFGLAGDEAGVLLTKSEAARMVTVRLRCSRARRLRRNAAGTASEVTRLLGVLSADLG